MTPKLTISKQRLMSALSGSGWNIRKAAGYLKITAPTARKLMNTYGVKLKPDSRLYRCIGCGKEFLHKVPRGKAFPEDIDSECCREELAHKIFQEGELD